MTRSIRPLLPWLALAAALLAPARAGLADDTVLFTSAVAPNVMMLVDNSGSMNHLVWHPAFDPTLTPSCSNWNNNTTYFFSSNSTQTRCGNTRTIYHDGSVSGDTRVDGRYLNWNFSDAADTYFKGASNNDPDNIAGPPPFPFFLILIDFFFSFISS